MQPPTESHGYESWRTSTVFLSATEGTAHVNLMWLQVKTGNKVLNRPWCSSMWSFLRQTLSQPPKRKLWDDRLVRKKAVSGDKYAHLSCCLRTRSTKPSSLKPSTVLKRHLCVIVNNYWSLSFPESNLKRIQTHVAEDFMRTTHQRHRLHPTLPPRCWNSFR